MCHTLQFTDLVASYDLGNFSEVTCMPKATTMRARKTFRQNLSWNGSRDLCFENGTSLKLIHTVITVWLNEMRCRKTEHHLSGPQPKQWARRQHFHVSKSVAIWIHSIDGMLSISWLHFSVVVKYARHRSAQDRIFNYTHRLISRLDLFIEYAQNAIHIIQISFDTKVHYSIQFSSFGCFDSKFPPDKRKKGNKVFSDFIWNMNQLISIVKWCCYVKILYHYGMKLIGYSIRL